MEINLPYLDEEDSCAVKGTEPDDGCLAERDMVLGTDRLDVELGELLIFRVGLVLVGAVRIRLKTINFRITPQKYV